MQAPDAQMEDAEGSEGSGDDDGSEEDAPSGDDEGDDDGDEDADDGPGAGMKLAACSVDFNVGFFSDQESGFEGISHFLEHMVFMGSEKYPGRTTSATGSVSTGVRRTRARTASRPPSTSSATPNISARVWTSSAATSSTLS